MTRRTIQVLSTVVILGTLAANGFAAEGGQVVTKTWIDLLKATGLVGILLVITSMVGTAILIQYLVNLNRVRSETPRC